MKGDFSRQRFRPAQRFASVRHQQGRVPLDAELNEAADIGSYLDATTRTDTIGPCGVPKTGGGFALTRLQATLDSGTIHQDFAIAPGRIYVDGILGETPTSTELTVLNATATTLDVAAVTATGTPIARTSTGEAIATLNGTPFAIGQWVQLLAADRAPQTLLITAVAALEVEGQPITRLTVQPEDTEGAAIADPDTLSNPQVRRLETLLHQADFPDFTYPAGDFPATLPPPPALPPLPDAPGTYLAYVDLWQRHLTALEVPDLREVALGGPDTTTRLRTLCPVKLVQVGEDDVCADFGRDWQPTAPSTGRLKARSQPDPLRDRPCIVPAQAGYRRLENQLYRVEIHQGTDPEDASVIPTFKWSRDNGTLVAQWLNPAGDPIRLRVDSLGPDEVRRFRSEQWVEITDETYDLHHQRGLLRQLLDAKDDTLLLATEDAVDGADFPRQPKIRAWDHAATTFREADGTTTDLPLEAGAIPVREGVWIDLEDGVQVYFDEGGTYTSGDYWLIPARVIGGDVIWPRNDSDEPLLEPPLGIDHHYCRLGLLTRTETEWSDLVEDCRPLFPPLTELDDRGCCRRVRVGDDLQQAVDQAIAAGGGCLCLEHGVHIVRGPLRLTNARHLTISGESPVTTLALIGVDADGLGGVLLAHTRHVTLEQLLVVGVDVPATIQLRPDAAPNQHLALNQLNVANLTNAAQTFAPPCALRLMSAEHLHLAHCRFFADVGLLSLLGEALPTLPDDQYLAVDGDEESTTISFDAIDATTRFTVGDSLPVTSPELTTAFQTFTYGNNRTTDGGFALVDARQRSGGSGQDLELNNINLRLDFTNPQPRVAFQFTNYGGNINLRVNGELRNRRSLSMLDGDTIAGVSVTLEPQPFDDDERGQLILTGDIQQVAIGGQELWIDDIIVGEAAAPPAARPLTAPVSHLDLENVGVFFGRYGIWAVHAWDWHLQDCQVQALSPTADQTNEVLRISTTLAELSEAPRSQNLETAQDLLTLLDQLAAAPAEPRGTAIQGLVWSQCQILRSQLQSDRGVAVAWWIDGAIRHCQIRSQTQGLYALWLHHAQWSDNQLRCPEGIALAWGGCHRVALRQNQVRQSRVGLATVPSDRALAALLNSLTEVRAAYSDDDDDTPLVVWWVLRPLVVFWRLRPMLDTLQQAANLADFAFPVLYLLVERALYPLLNQEQPPALPLPTIALKVDSNDIEADRACIRLNDLFTLGGITMQHNRLQTLTGQALQLTAAAGTQNLALVIVVWRALMAQLVTLLNNLANALLQAAQNPQNELAAPMPEIVRLVARAVRQLSQQVDRWRQESEGFLDADYRIEANQIRSRRTAIATNLFELVIANNHITLQEGLASRRDWAVIVEALSESEALRPLAIALREGSAADLSIAIAALQDNPDQLTNPNAVQAAGGALVTVASNVASPTVRTAAQTLSRLLSNNQRPAAAIIEALEGWREALLNFIDSYGIYLQGAGCRVQGNHLLAGTDADPDTWTRGGIRLSLTFAELLQFLGLAAALQQIIFANAADPVTASQLTPLLGVTETLVDNNEILGGVGHGIDIPGANDVPEILFQLKLRNNQISGMAGCGIFIGEEAMVVNLDIAGNRINACAYGVDLADPSGLLIQGAVLCRLHHNRVNGCGPRPAGDTDDASEADSDRPFSNSPYALILETIYDLHCTDNSVQFNQFGGALLRDVTGAAIVNDNDLSNNGGMCLLWENFPRQQFAANDFKAATNFRATVGSEATLPELVAALQDTVENAAAITPLLAIALFAQLTNRPLPIELQFGLSRATVNSNQLGCFVEDIPAFWISGLQLLTFTGNTAIALASLAGRIEDIEQAVVANNQLLNNG